MKGAWLHGVSGVVAALVLVNVVVLSLSVLAAFHQVVVRSLKSELESVGPYRMELEPLTDTCSGNVLPVMLTVAPPVNGLVYLYDTVTKKPVARVELVQGRAVLNLPCEGD